MFSISVTALTGLTNQKRKRRGEANLIRVEDRCGCIQPRVQIAAIDAGFNKSSEIAEILCRSKLQTLVLTHDDGDHINGAEYVLRNSPEPIEELWVPAYWMMQDAVLKQLASNSATGDDEQEKDKALNLSFAVASSEGQIFAGSAFEPLIHLSPAENERPAYDRDAPRAHREGPEIDGKRREEQPNLPAIQEQLEDGIETALRHIRRAGINLYRQRTREGRTTPFGGWNTREMAKRTTQRIGAIDAILSAARDRGTRIRCFLPATDATYSRGNIPPSPAWQTSGDPGFLTIVNALEVVVGEPRLSEKTALHMLLTAVVELSQQNRAALVSFVWPAHNSADNGFLVWSDSSGDWMGIPEFQVPWSQIGGMTAPHHGSANVAHKDIWNELSRNKGKTRIVVSGDLIETRGRTTRAAEIRKILESSRADEYGVVHCLDPQHNDRFPRTEVEYSSYTEKCCLIWKLSGFQFETQTQITISQFSACDADCLGCNPLSPGLGNCPMPTPAVAALGGGV